METLDLGGIDNDIQQILAVRATKDMETKAPALKAITNAHSTIIEEGTVVLPNASALPSMTR